jgi:hypothetical protein
MTEAAAQQAAGSAESLRGLAEADGTTYQAIRSYLSGLSPEGRRQAIEAVGGVKRQARLWELAAEGPDITLEDLVPRAEKALEPVIFYGKNSLPLFTIFQKRMARATKGDWLVGYNHGSTQGLVGPGYFTVHVFDGQIGEVGVDYTRLPDEKPASWPDIKPNKAGLSRFVYYDMIDYLRELAPGVLIGRAVRSGKITNNYFLLAREK